MTDPLFQAYPELASEIDRLCELPPWKMTGASALVVTPRGLLFELTKPKHWEHRADDTVVVGLGAIGGSLEKDELLLDCLQREAREELGRGLEILSTPEAAFVYEQQQVTYNQLPKRHYPLPALFTVSKNLYRQDDLPRARTLAIATFWARTTTAPRLGDLFGYVTVPIEKLANLLTIEEIPQDRLDLSDVDMVTRQPLPNRTVVRPVWTARSLQILFQSGWRPQEALLSSP